MLFFFAAFAELLDNSLDEVIELPLLFLAMFGRWESTGQHVHDNMREQEFP